MHWLKLDLLSGKVFQPENTEIHQFSLYNIRILLGKLEIFYFPSKKVSCPDSLIRDSLDSFFFFFKNLSFKIEMSGWVGVGRRPRFTFWLTFFQSCMLPLFFSGLLSYLVGMKRWTSRCVTCKRDNYHFVCYVLTFVSPLLSEVYLLVNLFTKLYITFILNRIAFIFGRDEDEDQ